MMPSPAAFLSSHRILASALAISAAVHAAVMLGVPAHLASLEPASPSYAVTLQAPAAQGIAAAPSPQLRRIAGTALRPIRARAAAAGPEAGAPVMAEAPVLASAPPPVAEVSPELLPPAEPDVVAAAQPLEPLPAAQPDPFPVEALPAGLSIAYQLSSSFADGRATYTWEREGDNYRITGEAEAEGFFALFLEGQIQQESRGTVTETGLRPERFVERRPNNVQEGLEFDWPRRQVTFSRGGKSNSSEISENTMDWLSMIFQLAHVPPAGQTTAIQVFTQRKMYRYRLQVLGVEEIEIPLGRIRALHLRHDDPADDREAVDVWLGLEQHYLPVKLRFPVSRKRLMVEQVATRVSTRAAR